MHKLQFFLMMGIKKKTLALPNIHLNFIKKSLNSAKVALKMLSSNVKLGIKNLSLLLSSLQV